MNHSWHPCAQDQEFGMRLAADERLLDQMIADLDAKTSPFPRAGGKAPTVGSPPLQDRRASRASGVDAWLRLVPDRGDVDGPVTLAAVLDAATQAHPPATM